jgi:hypothetical protein
LRATFSVALLVAGLSVAAARCDAIFGESPTLDELISDKQRFDKKPVCIEGIASGVNETTSCSGNDYTTIVVTEPQSNRKVTVFMWGHPGIAPNAQIQCSGKFEIKKVVTSRCNGTVRRIPFEDQISGTCAAK